MASPEDVVQVQVGGHEIRLTAKPEEVEHIRHAAARVTESLQKLQQKIGGAASPTKVATMCAFQFAFELALADAMLEDAQRLHDALATEKQAVQRLESLLARVDDALAY